MLNLWHMAAAIAARTTGLLDGQRAPLLALAWVFSNIALGWVGVIAGHPNFGALIAGALDGAVFSAIVLVRASGRLEAGMTGLLSGFGLDSITNQGKTVAAFVHSIHEVLETIVSTSATELHPEHHKELELVLMRAIWMAIIVMLLTLFVKWGQNQANPAAQTPPALVAVALPAERSRGQAA
jgi:sensor c-di-GMP phosphodiesterase-like protein